MLYELARRNLLPHRTKQVKQVTSSTARKTGECAMWPARNTNSHYSNQTNQHHLVSSTRSFLMLLYNPNI